MLFSYVWCRRDKNAQCIQRLYFQPDQCCSGREQCVNGLCGSQKVILLIPKTVGSWTKKIFNRWFLALHIPAVADVPALLALVNIAAMFRRKHRYSDGHYQERLKSPQHIKNWMAIIPTFVGPLNDISLMTSLRDFIRRRGLERISRSRHWMFQKETWQIYTWCTAQWQPSSPGKRWNKPVVIMASVICLPKCDDLSCTEY